MPLQIDDNEAELLDIDGQAFDADDESYVDDGSGMAMPETMEEAELLEALHKDLLRGEYAKEILAEAEMRRVIEASKSLGEARSIDGLGNLAARVPTSVFHHWGLRYGYEIWNKGSDLFKYLEKRNPGFMVRTARKTVGCGHTFPKPRDAVKPSEEKYILPVTSAGKVTSNGHDARMAAGARVAPAVHSRRA